VQQTEAYWLSIFRLANLPEQEQTLRVYARRLAEHCFEEQDLPLLLHADSLANVLGDQSTGQGPSEAFVFAVAEAAQKGKRGYNVMETMSSADANDACSYLIHRTGVLARRAFHRILLGMEFQCAAWKSIFHRHNTQKRPQRYFESHSIDVTAVRVMIRVPVLASSPCSRSLSQLIDNASKASEGGGSRFRSEDSLFERECCMAHDHVPERQLQC